MGRLSPRARRDRGGVGHDRAASGGRGPRRRRSPSPAGWGMIAQLAAGAPVAGALLLPLGLAAAIVVAGTLTAFTATAPAAAPVVGAGAVVGLVLGCPARRLEPLR